MKFELSPTIKAFHESDKFLKVVCGPVGGGKSSGALMAMFRAALDQYVGPTGIRRTKWVVLRNTMAQLRSTVKPLIDQWFVELPGQPLGAWRVSENTFEIRMDLPDGSHVWTEFVMLAADTPDDVRRLLSMEASGAWIEEAREVAREVAEGLMGRVGRFPNRAQGGVKYKCVLCSTNPPPVGTYWHELMTNPPKNCEVFIQPPALLDDGSLNPDAENLHNLPPNYYADLAEGKSEDWIAVYLKNKFGSGGFGKPVFRSTFNNAFHVSKNPLMPVVVGQNRIIIGSDNGLTAGAVIGQRDAMGRINIFRCPHVPEGETMGYDRFLRTVLIPQLDELRVPRKNCTFIVDPACFHRSEATETTIAQVIASEGFEVLPAPTNKPERCISSAEGLLMRQVDGQALLRISPECGHLINALDWGYRNKKISTGQTVAAPEKNHFSHVADGFMAFCLHFNNPAGAVQKSVAREVQRVAYAY